jgi:hypothetical protein
MDLLTPEIGLLFWTLMILSTIVLLLIASISVITRKSRTDATSKLIWIIVVIFVPLLGPILYLTVGRKQGRVTIQ